MLRLEPGYVTRIALAADLAEADKGVHPVLVATHRLDHSADARDVRIGRDVEQIVMAEQPLEQAIEQGNALTVPMQDGDLRQFDEACGHVERSVRRLQRCLW